MRARSADVFRANLAALPGGDQCFCRAGHLHAAAPPRKPGRGNTERSAGRRSRCLHGHRRNAGVPRLRVARARRVCGVPGLSHEVKGEPLPELRPRAEPALERVARIARRQPWAGVQIQPTGSAPTVAVPASSGGFLRAPNAPRNLRAETPPPVEQAESVTFRLGGQTSDFQNFRGLVLFLMSVLFADHVHVQHVGGICCPVIGIPARDQNMSHVGRCRP